jgi:hypothetical protein
MEDYKILNWIVVMSTLVVVVIVLLISGVNSAFSQSTSTTMDKNNNSSSDTAATATAQLHANHTFDNLIISEHIPLTGELSSGDYILLMDFTPFVTSVEEHSHIALKVPCNEDASPKVSIVTGITPNLKTLDIGSSMNNGTIDGNNIDLSLEGSSCLYHAELPNNISDIMLVNTSNQTLNFNEGRYNSVTVSAHGTAIQHMADPMG